jgi:hypothetical protein
VLQCVHNSLTSLSELSDVNYILEVSTVFLQKVFNFLSSILGFKGLNFSLVDSLFLTSSFEEKLCIPLIIRLGLVVLKGIGMNDSLSLVENKLMISIFIVNRLDVLNVIGLSDLHLYFDGRSLNLSSLCKFL